MRKVSVEGIQAGMSVCQAAVRLVKAPGCPPKQSWQSITCHPGWKGAGSTEVLKQEPSEQDGNGGQRRRPEHTEAQSGFTLDFRLSKRKSQASLVAQTVKNQPTMPEARFDPRVGKITWRRKWQPTPVFLPGKSQGQRSPTGYTV